MAQAKKGTKTATTKKDDKYIKGLEERLKKMEEVINKFSTMNIGSDQPTVNNITQYIGEKLGNIYKKLLSYEEMLGLFNKDREAFEKVFVSMANNQKETLKRIIFKKLEDDEKKVDMNIVRVIDENMGTNIMEEFSNQKKLSELIKE